MFQGGSVDCCAVAHRAFARFNWAYCSTKHLAQGGKERGYKHILLSQLEFWEILDLGKFEFFRFFRKMKKCVITIV